MTISAATFVDKYDSGDRWDYIDRLPSIDKPLLVLFGSKEIEDERSTFHHVDSIVRSVIRDDSSKRCYVVEGADHNYTDRRDALNAQLIHFLRHRRSDAGH